ncbi:MAG: hypothetical protein O9972_09650 [Burkholderiales bacterium]|nr:hypothetical protein [Burkholderiales bacterium]
MSLIDRIYEAPLGHQAIAIFVLGVLVLALAVEAYLFVRHRCRRDRRRPVDIHDRDSWGV